jgi:predicted nucleic-acid-binding protein
MLAIDTNVAVRYLTADHPEQSRQARALIDNAEVFVATTVLLEMEWVLRGAYGYSALDVARALRGFAGLARVTLEDASLAATAIAWMEQGMDFADALHLARAADCEAFVSFDRRLAKVARTFSRVKVRGPSGGRPGR